VFHAKRVVRPHEAPGGTGGRTTQFISPQTFYRADRFPVSDKSNTFLTRCQLTPVPIRSLVVPENRATIDTAPVQCSLRPPGVQL